MAIEYPRRERFWAHKLTRALFKSCAAQDIGWQSVLLVIHIAHTEDAARYVGPVRFWNSQLMETLGFSSPKQLSTAREKAIEAGWLVYERQHDRSVGRYYTMMPSVYSELADTPIEESECVLSIPLEEKETEKEGEKKTESIPLGEKETEREAEQEGDGKRPRKDTGSGKPSNPIPNPGPYPNLHLSVLELFEKFLEHIFRKTGQRVGDIRREELLMEVLRRGDNAEADLRFSILKDAKSLLHASNDYNKLRADAERSKIRQPKLATVSGKSKWDDL